MRYIINKINKGEDELILNYKEKNPEVEAVLLFMDKRQRKLIGRKNDETIVFTPEEILYIEKVDNKTFVYTDDNEMPYGRVPQGHPEIVDYFYHEEIRGTENTGKRNR